MPVSTRATYLTLFEPHDHGEGREVRKVCILKDTGINKNFIFINVEKLLSG